MTTAAKEATPLYINNVIDQVSMALRPATAILTDKPSSKSPQSRVIEGAINFINQHVQEEELPYALLEASSLAEGLLGALSGQIHLGRTTFEKGNSVVFSGRFTNITGVEKRPWDLKMGYRSYRIGPPRDTSLEPYFSVQASTLSDTEDNLRRTVTCLMKPTFDPVLGWNMMLFSNVERLTTRLWEPIEPSSLSQAIVLARKVAEQGYRTRFFYLYADAQQTSGYKASLKFQGFSNKIGTLLTPNGFLLPQAPSQTASGA